MDRVLDLHVFTERRGMSLQMKMQPGRVFTDLQKREKLGKKEK